MSHKIAKARRAAQRHSATPNQMHLILVEANRAQRRASAHKLKDTSSTRSRTPGARRKGRVRQAALRLVGGVTETDIQQVL